VATNELEEKRLLDLWERANQNEVLGLELVDRQGIKDREPACEGIRAIWSPHTGIVDWGEVAKHYGKVFVEKGGLIFLNYEASNFSLVGQDTVRMVSRDGRVVECGAVLACAGLQADRVGTLTQCDPQPRIVPFRGEYLLLSDDKANSSEATSTQCLIPDSRFSGSISLRE